MSIIAEEVQNLLLSEADPLKAEGMQNYMRNLFPFLGVSSPDRKSILRPIIRRYKGLNHQEKMDVLNTLWLYEGRECQYAAVDP